MSELKQLTYGPFDIGLAEASILIDFTQDPDPDLEMHSERVRDWIGVTLAAYLSALNILEDEKPDLVYVMNGRWSYTRSVLRACQVKGVECRLHEVAGDSKRYWVGINRLPHAIKKNYAAIEEAWRRADPAEREVVASTFYTEKASGIERAWYSYVADQKHGQLPNDWDPARRNIAVFMSSEFEFSSIGPEYAFPFYSDQNDGLMRLTASLEAINAPVHLNIRVHPHMKGLRNANLERVVALRSPKATVIPPESPVSSYELMRACEKTLTFGSTLGIEAAYWGKPSILAGAAAYQQLGATYNPASHDELISLLLADLSPKSKEAALRYGYYQLRQGTEFLYYEPETPWRGKFKGRDVDQVIPWYWRLILRFVRVRRFRWLSPIVRLSSWHAGELRKQLGIPVRAEKVEPTALIAEGQP